MSFSSSGIIALEVWTEGGVREEGKEIVKWQGELIQLLLSSPLVVVVGGRLLLLHLITNRMRIEIDRKAKELLLGRRS